MSVGLVGLRNEAAVVDPLWRSVTAGAKTLPALIDPKGTPILGSHVADMLIAVLLRNLREVRETC